MVAKTVEIFEPYYNPYDITERDVIVLFKNTTDGFVIYHRLDSSKWCAVVGNMGKVKVGDIELASKDVKRFTKTALDNGDRVFVAQETLFYNIPTNFINVPAKTLNSHRTVARKPVRKTVRKTKRA